MPNITPFPDLHVTVKRSLWLRGEGSMKSVLFRPEDNKMCCLGFACLELGFTTEELNNVGTPNSICYQNKPTIEERVKREEKLKQLNGSAIELRVNDIIGLLMTVNDNVGIKDKDREVQLINEGAKIGLIFTFVD